MELPVRRVVVMVLLAVIIPASSSSSSSNSTAQRTPVRLSDYDLLLLSEWSGLGQTVTAYSSSGGSTTSIPLHGYFPNVTFSSAAANAPTNTLFLAGTNDNGSSLLTYLNVFTGEAGILLTRQRTAMSDLVHWNGTLFWVENSTTLVSARLLDQPTTAQVLLVAPDQFKIEGLTVDQQGTLYYTTWPPRTRTNSSIHKLHPGATTTNNSTTLASGLLLPHSLYYSSATGLLYYISNPPGIYFTVEQMNATTGDHRTTTIMKQAHKHGGSLAVTCTGDVFWSDVVDKRVWKMDRKVSKKKVPGGSVVPVNGQPNVLAVFASPECQHKFNLTTLPDNELPSRSSSSSSEESGVTSTVTPPPRTSTTTSTSSTVPPPVTAKIRLCSEMESESVGCSGVCVYVRSPTCLSSSPPQEELTQVAVHDPGAYAWPPYVIALISVLSTVATIMSLISVYMTVRVRTLSKKPIIRRRVVVSRSESSSNPTSVCEMIDIENCCNMNVCETPCYERTLLQQPSSSTTSTTNSSTTISVNSSNGTWGPCSTTTTTKKDDKRCLLGR